MATYKELDDWCKEMVKRHKWFAREPGVEEFHELVHSRRRMRGQVPDEVVQALATLERNLLLIADYRGKATGVAFC